MDITTGMKKRWWPGPVDAFGLTNEALFCLLYKGKKQGPGKVNMPAYTWTKGTGAAAFRCRGSQLDFGTQKED